ncbi:hypothetical protein Vafri_11621 [Volvox africanus]|uniref:Uncharacterized protein n=1 Tax=Volvox africanus TaxID=51714 RepID=A0A8J4BCY3_9CHLO|nr:hypothetical protein Vafri_11621 [Volvox africanus]
MRVLMERLSNRPKAQVFDRAEVNEERLFSEYYGRARSRVSYYMLVMYEMEGQGMVPYIAKLRFFLKLPIVPDGPTTVQEASRLAVVELVRARMEGELYVTDHGSESYKHYAVSATTLKGRIEKLVTAVPMNEPRGRQYYMTYCHMAER